MLSPFLRVRGWLHTGWSLETVLRVSHCGRIWSADSHESLCLKWCEFSQCSTILLILVRVRNPTALHVVRVHWLCR
jgi:hypothetical protein